MRLAFALELHRAECVFLTGELAAAEERLTMLSSRAADTVELATVTCLRVDLYTTLDQSDRAVDVGLDYLRYLGVEWSPHPAAEEGRREYERIWSQLGSRAIEQLIDLPLMSDPASIATLDVLTKVLSPAFFTDANLASLVVCWMVNLSLEHGSSDGSSFDDEQFDELRFERHLASVPAALPAALPGCYYWIRKLQARFFAGDYASAIDASLRAQQLLWTAPSQFAMAEYHFYSALSRAASCDSAFPDRQHLSSEASAKEEHLEALAAHYRQLEVWAENCPENFGNRASLVAGEIARLEGRDFEAMRLYEEAIRLAHTNGFVHNEALANELAAHFYMARGFEKIAGAYLRDTRYCYLRWGAAGKVRQLEQFISAPQGGRASSGSNEHDRRTGRTPGSGYRYQSLASSFGRNGLGETDRDAHAHSD